MQLRILENFFSPANCIRHFKTFYALRYTWSGSTGAGGRGRLCMNVAGENPASSCEANYIYIYTHTPTSNFLSPIRIAVKAESQCWHWYYSWTLLLRVIPGMTEVHFCEQQHTASLYHKRVHNMDDYFWIFISLYSFRLFCANRC